uniref:Uncharacterized protein n=1 Tax=Calcidiscus leptoporus TaxID=127549 RepID=A0A7S0IIB3_9EUKA
MRAGAFLLISSGSALQAPSSQLQLDAQVRVRSHGCVTPRGVASLRKQRLRPSVLGAPAPFPARRTGGALMQTRPSSFELSSLVAPAVFAALFFSGALGWLLNIILGLQLLIFVLPVVAVPLFQWWLSANLLEGACPTCGVTCQALKGQESQCMQCGTIYTSELEQGFFRRQRSQTGDGVVDVDVDVLD